MSYDYILSIMLVDNFDKTGEETHCRENDTCVMSRNHSLELLSAHRVGQLKSPSKLWQGLGCLPLCKLVCYANCALAVTQREFR